MKPDYMDFYMGTIWMRGRAGLSVVHRMLFGRLKEAGCTWRYSFPRLGLVDLRPLREELAMADGVPEWSASSPSESFDRQQRQETADAEIGDLRRDLDDVYRREVEAARHRAPPPIVAAFQTVFGHNPEGWPPEIEA